MPKIAIMTPRPSKKVDTSTYTGRFAARLKELREKAGLTPEQFAEQLAVSDQAIYYWESGLRQPKISDLPKIASVLKLKKTRDLLPNE